MAISKTKLTPCPEQESKDITTVNVNAVEIVSASETEKKLTKTRKGRIPSFQRPATSPSLFSDGLTDRIASSRVIWEGCNILTQGPDIGWSTPEGEAAYYESSVARGKGVINFWVSSGLYTKDPSLLEGEAALALIEEFDIRAACMHLIYAAHATQLERPWEQQFVLSDTQLESYLGLDKHKNLNKEQKLQLMLELAKQPCHLIVYVSWPSQGQVPTLSVSKNWLWEIAEPILHFQDCLRDENGNQVGGKTLVGFDLKIRCGNWAMYFLNAEERKKKNAYYEYGFLSQEILHNVMASWHHSPGAARLMTWLLFRTKINRNSPLTVEVLLKVAFGGEALQAAIAKASDRRSLVNRWLTALRILIRNGWQITPDPESYPMEYWIKTGDTGLLNQIPDDPDAALEFWVSDGKKGTRLTDQIKRLPGSFDRFLTGRLWVNPPPVIAEKLNAIEEYRKRLKGSEAKKENFDLLPSETSNQLGSTKIPPIIDSGDDLRQFRVAKGWTQADLAEKMGRSVSWIKMVERGKRSLQPQDRKVLATLSKK